MESEHASTVLGIVDERHAGHFWIRFLEQLQPLPVLGPNERDARDVASRVSEAGNEARFIGKGNVREHDRNDRRRLFGRECGFATGDHHDVDLRIDQLGGQASKSAHLLLSPPRLKDYVLSLHVPQLA